jgi:cytochrome c oxidase subunit 2
MRRARHGMARSGWAVLLLLPLLLGGCSTWMPEGATPQGREIRELWNVLLFSGAAVYVFVQGLIIWAVIRYRKRDDKLPRQTHGNNLLEITWTAVPLVMVTVLFLMSWQGIQTVNAQSDGDDVRLIRVEGFQWQWAFTYVGEEVPPPEDAPEGEEQEGEEQEPAEPESLRLQGSISQPPEMVLPVGEPVRVELQSTDVLHSFFVPGFNYKLDVVPGRTNSFEVTPDRLGTFPGQCAEYCGLSHNDMHFTVRVVEPAEFETWLSDAKEQAASGCPEDPTPGQITSDNIEFDKTCMIAEAGTDFQLSYTNLEAEPHNVAVFDGDSAEAPNLFRGEIISGPDTTVTYDIGALEPGEYFFHCDVHPQAMTGTLVVR